MTRVNGVHCTTKKGSISLNTPRVSAGGRKSKLAAAKQGVYKAWTYAYRDRKAKKRTNRALWQIHINAVSRAQGISYSRFMGALRKNHIAIDRKILSQLTESKPDIVAKIVEKSQINLFKKTTPRRRGFVFCQIINFICFQWISAPRGINPAGQPTEYPPWNLLFSRLPRSGGILFPAARPQGIQNNKNPRCFAGYFLAGFRFPDGNQTVYAAFFNFGCRQALPAWIHRVVQNKKYQMFFQNIGLFQRCHMVI